MCVCCFVVFFIKLSGTEAVIVTNNLVVFFFAFAIFVISDGVWHQCLHTVFTVLFAIRYCDLDLCDDLSKVKDSSYCGSTLCFHVT